MGFAHCQNSLDLARRQTLIYVSGHLSAGLGRFIESFQDERSHLAARAGIPVREDIRRDEGCDKPNAI